MTDVAKTPGDLPPGSKIRLTARFEDPADALTWMLRQVNGHEFDPKTVQFGETGRTMGRNWKLEVWVEGCTPDPEAAAEEQWLTGTPV